MTKSDSGRESHQSTGVQDLRVPFKQEENRVVQQKDVQVNYSGQIPPT